jgi:hypothetical protein
MWRIAVSSFERDVYRSGQFWMLLDLSGKPLGPYHLDPLWPSITRDVSSGITATRRDRQKKPT